MQNLFGINNNYLGMFKKTDTNNSSIKIGRSMQFVDSSKVDPTQETNTKSKVFMPYEEKYKPYTYCNKDKKDKRFDRNKFLNQPLNKDIYKIPMKA